MPGFFSNVYEEDEKILCITIPDYLAVRFGEKAALIRWLAGILIAGFMFFYVAAQFSGTGKLFLLHLICTQFRVYCLPLWLLYYIFDWWVYFRRLDRHGAKYSDDNGACCFTDFAFIYIFTNDLSVTHALTADGDSFNSWFGGLTGFSLGVLFFNNFSWSFGYFGGQPQLSSRFMAMSNEKEAKSALLSVFSGRFLLILVHF